LLPSPRARKKEAPSVGSRVPGKKEKQPSDRCDEKRWGIDSVCWIRKEEKEKRTEKIFVAALYIASFSNGGRKGEGKRRECLTSLREHGIEKEKKKRKKREGEGRGLISSFSRGWQRKAELARERGWTRVAKRGRKKKRKASTLMRCCALRLGASKREKGTGIAITPEIPSLPKKKGKGTLAITLLARKNAATVVDLHALGKKKGTNPSCSPHHEKGGAGKQGRNKSWYYKALISVPSHIASGRKRRGKKRSHR